MARRRRGGRARCQVHSRGDRAEDVLIACLAAGGVFAGSAVIGLLPTVAGASSHREAPLILADPAVDNTDVYAFSSPQNPDNVTFVANWTPFEEPNGGPNFYPWADDAQYLINIDNNGDAVADVIYRWRFRTQDQRGAQHVPVQQRAGHLARRREPAVPPVLHPRREHRRRSLATATRSPRARPRRPSPVPRAWARQRTTSATCARRPSTRVAGGGPHAGHPVRGPVLPGPAGLRPAVRRRPLRAAARTPWRATTSTASC